MAGLGNPLSFELGGGPSPQESVYDAVYQNVGDGIRSSPNSLVESWRVARARGVAAAEGDGRAAMQAFPDLSTDYLPIFEDLLGIVPAADASEQERRNSVENAWTRTIDATYPKLDDSLQSLDPLFSILLLPYEYSRVTVPGRAFEDWDPGDSLACGPAFNTGLTYTNYPNYSDDFVLFLLFDVGSALNDPSNQRTLQEALDLLNESLPSWVDFRLFANCGFVLDEDDLDITAFCDGIVLP